jgi:hypothetical protein
MVGEWSIHLEIFESIHKPSFFFLKFYLHRPSTYILDKIMGELLSNNGGEEDGLAPS